MSYSVVKNETGKFDIIEKDSDVVIEINRAESEARSICRKLNLGSGFNGWTPPFFAITI
jgi:hypothetical protein